MATQLAESFVKPLVHEDTDLWQLAKEITPNNYEDYRAALNTFLDQCDDDTLSKTQKQRVGTIQRYLWNTSTAFTHENFQIAQDSLVGGNS